MSKHAPLHVYVGTCVRKCPDCISVTTHRCICQDCVCRGAK